MTSGDDKEAKQEDTDLTYLFIGASLKEGVESVGLDKFHPLVHPLDIFFSILKGERR